MPLHANRPRLYDHTDGDIVVIHVSQLSAHLKEIISEVRSYGFRIAVIAISMTLWMAAFFVEEFRSVGGITGDGLRAFLLVSAFTLTALGLHMTIRYFLRRDGRDHDSYIAHLTSIKPLTRSEIEVFFTGEPDNKKTPR